MRGFANRSEGAKRLEQTFAVVRMDQEGAGFFPLDSRIHFDQTANYGSELRMACAQTSPLVVVAHLQQTRVDDEDARPVMPGDLIFGVVCAMDTADLESGVPEHALDPPLLLGGDARSQNQGQTESHGGLHAYRHPLHAATLRGARCLRDPEDPPPSGPEAIPESRDSTARFQVVDRICPRASPGGERERPGPGEAIGGDRLVTSRIAVLPFPIVTSIEGAPLLYVVRIITQDSVEDLKVFSNFPEADRRLRAAWFWLLKQERGGDPLWDPSRDPALIERIEDLLKLDSVERVELHECQAGDPREAANEVRNQRSMLLHWRDVEDPYGDLIADLFADPDPIERNP